MLHVHIADPFFRGHPNKHAAQKCSMDIDIDKGIDTKMDVAIDMETLLMDRKIKWKYCKELIS